MATKFVFPDRFGGKMALKKRNVLKLRGSLLFNSRNVLFFESFEQTKSFLSLLISIFEILPNYFYIKFIFPIFFFTPNTIIQLSVFFNQKFFFLRLNFCHFFELFNFFIENIKLKCIFLLLFYTQRYDEQWSVFLDNRSVKICDVWSRAFSDLPGSDSSERKTLWYGNTKNSLISFIYCKFRFWVWRHRKMTSAPNFEENFFPIPLIY